MKKRILFITILLLAAMVFTSALLAEETINIHLVQRGGGGGCFESATGVGTGIPDNNPTGVCFPVTLGGPAGATVDDVAVTVAATHTWIGDLEFWLNSPDGSTLYMLDRPGYIGQTYPGCCGDSSDLSASFPISFYDASLNDAEAMGAGGGSNVVCQTNGVCDYFPNPEGAAGSLPDFAGFAGENVAGQWEFCAADNAGADTGSIQSFTVDVACTALIPDLVFTKTVGLNPNSCATTNSITIPAGQGGTLVTYCYDMTNTGTVTFELHAVVDDQLGTVLGPNFPFTVGPGQGAYFTVTTLITGTTVNSATWTATDAQGGNGVSASDTATVTQGTPTDVSLSSFSSDQAAASPIWLAGLFAIILGFGFVIRRRLIRAE